MACSNEVEVKARQGAQTPEGYWTEHENIDMCRQGDVQLVMDWRSKSSIEEMKRDVERLGYSSITVSNGHPSFPFAALKQFDFQLKPEHCKPISSCCKHPCKIYIWHPKAPPSHWRTARSPSADKRLNGELNDTARNTNDADKLRHLVRDRNADLLSTNGPPWHHTPLHQAAYHGREQCARALLELLGEQGVLERCLEMDSNPCGRRGSGKPIELARGGGHAGIVRLLEEAASGCSAEGALGSPERTQSVTGRVGHWTEHTDIDMCGQGDVRILPNWRTTTTIEALKQMVEDHGFSAITVSNGNPSFGHAALKKFEYQLTPHHCKPISTCCRHPCKIYIWTPGVTATASGAAPAVVVAAPAQAAPMASPSTSDVPVVVGVPIQSAMDNYVSPDNGRCLVQATLAPSAPAATDEPFPGYIPAHDLQGCWACACVPFGWACFRKEARGPDSLLHHGCVFVCCVMPGHFREMRHRVPGMNGFHKEGESKDQNVDHYDGRRCVCNGPSCSLRLC